MSYLPTILMKVNYWDITLMQFFQRRNNRNRAMRNHLIWKILFWWLFFKRLWIFIFIKCRTVKVFHLLFYSLFEYLFLFKFLKLMLINLLFWSLGFNILKNFLFWFNQLLLFLLFFEFFYLNLNTLFSPSSFLFIFLTIITLILFNFLFFIL